jgi:enamine deaminase RidA (YjgF/YER057c/UK114 family)
MKTTLIAGILLAISFTVQAQQEEARPGAKKKFHFGKQQDNEAGYAQAIKVGRTIFVSGTVSLSIDSAGITRLYNTIEQTLAHFGASMQHVVKENLYTTDIEAMKANNRYRLPFYKNDFPAATWVQISRLYMPEAKLEVEVTAVLPN